MKDLEFKKYLERMDEYIKKAANESSEQSFEFLVSAGVLDKQGNQCSVNYREQK
jgi:hypothetical protein